LTFHFSHFCIFFIFPHLLPNLPPLICTPTLSSFSSLTSTLTISNDEVLVYSSCPFRHILVVGHHKIYDAFVVFMSLLKGGMSAYFARQFRHLWSRAKRGDEDYCLQSFSLFVYKCFEEIWKWFLICGGVKVCRSWRC
jgi:hypothetical protein